ncbi:hypothetical protein BN946_scf184940.g92 [Trametes cinnabarina]|uniref:DUF6532 domain-containing protein n=1 Tax=Pycnoporus cinnabarinus TaxID=5643 RepID=A0A060SC58_PYCCI|nr:hypothetical protein BN946_scf184940.g92 [Trametes cinnabarina]
MQPFRVLGIDTIKTAQADDGVDIAQKRVDYRTQATPQPGTSQGGVRLVAGFLNDRYSDDDDASAAFDNYVAHPRAVLNSYAYGQQSSENDRDVTPDATHALTPYDNDEPFDGDSAPDAAQQDSDAGQPVAFSSPQSAVSYATDEQCTNARSASPLQEHPANVGNYRKARRIIEAQEGSRQRARKGDYEPEAQEVLREAAVVFKSLLCSRDAYPNKLSEKTWAVDAWHAAAAKLDIKLAPTNEVLGLVAQYSWNLRGEIKNTARSLVPGAYGLKAGLTSQSWLYNRERAGFLRKARAFAYENINDTAEDHVGLYEAEIIQSIINRVFYKTATDDGVVLAKIYEPFPFVGLALILTAIQCSLDEWDTGAFSKVTFSEESYSGIYHRHLQELHAFEAESGADRILTEICARISARGRYVLLDTPLLLHTHITTRIGVRLWLGTG